MPDERKNVPTELGVVKNTHIVSVENQVKEKQVEIDIILNFFYKICFLH